MFKELNNDEINNICQSEHQKIVLNDAFMKNMSYAKYDSGNNDLDSLLLDMTKSLNYYYDICNQRFINGKTSILAEDCRNIKKIFDTYELLHEELKLFSINFVFIDDYLKRYNEIKDKLRNAYGSENNVITNTIKINKTTSIFIISKTNNLTCIKNIIFGSNKKPDIYIDDALENNIIIENEEKDEFLIFDRNVDTGITMDNLKSWYSEKYGGKQKLSERLKNGLNEIEVKVLTYYFKNYVKKNMNFPAIFPQVYLHYDPKTVKELTTICNGRKRVDFQRMDFLMLYNSKRIVIEIDGKEHFTLNDKMQYDINKYSTQVSYDRKMKFLGYDIFRIGGKELHDDFDNVIKTFFDKLMKYLSVEI